MTFNLFTTSIYNILDLFWLNQIFHSYQGSWDNSANVNYSFCPKCQLFSHFSAIYLTKDWLRIDESLRGRSKFMGIRGREMGNYRLKISDDPVVPGAPNKSWPRIGSSKISDDPVVPGAPNKSWPRISSSKISDDPVVLGPQNKSWPRITSIENTGITSIESCSEATNKSWPNITSTKNIRWPPLCRRSL